MRVLFTRRGFFPDLSNNDYLSFILTGTGGTVQIDHGPPFTEKYFYKSINSVRQKVGTRIEPTPHYANYLKNNEIVVCVFRFYS
jgi:hypothetical protein